MPYNSAIVGLVACSAWLFYFYAANLNPIFGFFNFDSSELPIITIYAFYIPVFVMFIKKHGKENFVKNTLLPILGIIASAFMVFAALWSHGITKYLDAKDNGYFSFPVLAYLIVFVVILAIGAFFYKKKNELDD